MSGDTQYTAHAHVSQIKKADGKIYEIFDHTRFLKLKSSLNNSVIRRGRITALDGKSALAKAIICLAGSKIKTLRHFEFYRLKQGQDYNADFDIEVNKLYSKKKKQ